ncbi:MAG TPA: PA2778 family cysteine peptidase [Noviherbaspirillum sp.]|nr:PA2778 family cysteine peptidase [Noviherbaspirillum sp.]
MPGVLLFLAVLLTGCATSGRALLQQASSWLPPRAELAATPFFPQERYQCGPAALAMSLAAVGIDVTPDALKAQVYVPQREGSLQPEMLAAARRNGAVAMTIPPSLDALLTELAAGHPVLVLQNLSLAWMPLWHYAVAIGYDLEQDEIILRSGTTERLAMPLSTFDRTWERSARWGMVTLPPGRLPATAGEAAVVDALLSFEKTSDAHRARKAYVSALQRWPRNLALQLGLGNTAYAAGDRSAAAAAFRQATQEHPGNAPAFINLATVLLELGEVKQARQAAENALALGGPWREAAAATLQVIENRK